MAIGILKIDAYHMGALFHFFEMATAFRGFLYGIRPFNQPGVEEGKNFHFYGMMGVGRFEAKKEEVERRERKR